MGASVKRTIKFVLVVIMMIIRKANVNDLNDIYQLMDSVDNKWFFKDDREYVYRHVEEEGFILVVDDDEIVAYLMVHYVDYDEDVDLHHVVYMDSVGVLESMRGHSLMKKLILYAEDVLRKNDIIEIETYEKCYQYLKEIK